MEADLTFSSRRSPVVSLHGCVASSQPLASNIGLGEFGKDVYTLTAFYNLDEYQCGKCIII